MNIYALLNSFMSTFDDYNSINIYRAILDSEQITLLKKKLKRKFKKFKKVLILSFICTPNGQILCRGPPFSKKQARPKNLSGGPVSL